MPVMKKKKIMIFDTHPLRSAGLESTVPTLKKFTVFNITNPEEVRKGARAVVEEVGPFVYRFTGSSLHLPPSSQEG